METVINETNIGTMPVLRGDAPLNLAPPVILRSETEIAHTFERLTEGGIEMSAAPLHSRVSGRTVSVYAGGRLAAMSAGVEPVRDEEGGVVAVRLLEEG